MRDLVCFTLSDGSSDDCSDSLEVFRIKWLVEWFFLFFRFSTSRQTLSWVPDSFFSR